MISSKKILLRKIYQLTIHKILAKIWRKIFSPKIIPVDANWLSKKHSKLKVFAKMLSKHEYKPDPMSGFADYTIKTPDEFFVSKHRDCDDFAQMWIFWAKENNFLYKRIFMSQNIFGGGHVVTAIRANDHKWWICEFGDTYQVGVLDKISINRYCFQRNYDHWFVL